MDKKISELASPERYQLLRTGLVAVSLLLVLGITVTIATASHTMRVQPEQPQEPITLVSTEVVTITRHGPHTTIIENVSGRTHGFERVVISRHRLSTAPPPRQEARTITDTLRIYTYRAAIVVYEIATGKIHII